MPRLVASLLALTLGSAAALPLAGCGEEDAQLLPGETAREITANLDAVKQLAAEDDCAGAENAAQQVSEQVEAVEGVDRRLKQALEDGAARLNEAIDECEEATAEAIAPATPSIETESDEERRPPEKADKDEKDEKDEGKDDEGKSDKEASEAPPASPSLPPQAEGEGKGLDKDDGSDPGSEGQGGGEGDVSPSGGVSPGSPAGGGQ